MAKNKVAPFFSGHGVVDYDCLAVVSHSILSYCHIVLYIFKVKLVNLIFFFCFHWYATGCTLSVVSCVCIVLYCLVILICGMTFCNDFIFFTLFYIVLCSMYYNIVS